MYKQKLLSTKEKRELLETLKKFYKTDIKKLEEHHFYYHENTQKLYISTINLEETNLNMNKIADCGLYFGTFHDKNRFRLSIEGTQFIEPKQNYILLNEKSLKTYISGEKLLTEEVDEVNWKDNAPFLIIKYNNENLGCANIKEDMILTYIPKSRRLCESRIF